ncbi:hypothetical protein B0T16DRAFT_423027 [Cercophora newfieldiana]|uniref:Genetic interactor of prohibitins 3, mitochondrial n=1 Tax=Cercophora newfieldiana TaxID=92897 RepID=A0AA40CI56_9PEZI|nr:hypothetical protein B0T16DRAFT_423027 [Cercophora newfieldiana]
MQMQPGRVLSARWLRNVFSIEQCSSSARLPVFLCPALQRAPFSSDSRTHRQLYGRPLQSRRLHAQTGAASASHSPRDLQQPQTPSSSVKTLPAQCSGCGALSQTTTPGLPGYFDLGRRSIAEYLGLVEPKPRLAREDDEAVKNALSDIDLAELEGQGVDLKGLIKERDTEPTPAAPDRAPICERCHGLIHHNTGTPIFHPSVESLRETIHESPYKYNHVYHVLDAADFPMSLVPRIDQLLEAMPLRSHNRRSRSSKFFSNKKVEISFIVTRADLLGAKKQDVDHLMPYLRQVLRDALGRSGRDVRLGNLKCVSAKRSWWTTELKEEIYQRGGAGWMVGKANVGKSNLFSAVFPKGRMDDKPLKEDISVDLFKKLEDAAKGEPVGGKALPDEKGARDGKEPLEGEDEYSFLPPLQPEEAYPAMPLVSSLPGTTASPIRLAFGGGKGELIDLPGLPRSDLESHVQEEHRASLIMRKRITPEQISITPGKSLLLGGFIRITPRTPDLVFLSYNFTPLKEHLTSTEKAIRVQTRTDPPNVENISLPEASENIQLAGSYELQYDVTKERAGPLTSKNARGLSPEQLPFRTLAVDILIEGCGWVEIVAEVRRKHFAMPPPQPKTPPSPPPTQPRRRDGEPELLQTLDLFGTAPEPEPLLQAEPPVQEEPQSVWPIVDVFTPVGRFVSSRRPMNGWLINKPKAVRLKKRPRKSMKQAKKREKEARRSKSGYGEE